MLKYDKRQVHLKRGHTYNEFVIAKNATSTSYDKLCDYLGISFVEAREIYDGIYNLPIESIGNTRLQTVKTGTDWHKKIEEIIKEEKER